MSVCLSVSVSVCQCVCVCVCVCVCCSSLLAILGVHHAAVRKTDNGRCTACNGHAQLPNLDRGRARAEGHQPMHLFFLSASNIRGASGKGG